MLDGWGIDSPSTKGAVDVLGKLGVDGRVLVVLGRDEGDVAVWKSLRNLQNVHVLSSGELNAYDVLVSDWVVFTEGLAAGRHAPRCRHRGKGRRPVKDARDVIVAPVVSEKSYALMEEGIYTFKVHPTASKPEIRDAVQSIFGVRVSKVNTLNRKGKRKRNRKTFTYGSRPDTKRAIVTLAEGETIDLFQD